MPAILAKATKLADAVLQWGPHQAVEVQVRCPTARLSSRKAWSVRSWAISKWLQRDRQRALGLHALLGSAKPMMRITLKPMSSLTDTQH